MVKVAFKLGQRPYSFTRMENGFLVINPYTREGVFLNHEGFDLFAKLIEGMWNGEDTFELAQEFIDKCGNKAYMRLVD